MQDSQKLALCVGDPIKRYHNSITRLAAALSNSDLHRAVLEVIHQHLSVLSNGNSRHPLCPTPTLMQGYQSLLLETFSAFDSLLGGLPW